MDLTSFRLTVGSIRVDRFFWVPELVLLEKIIHFTFLRVLHNKSFERKSPVPIIRIPVVSVLRREYMY